jgi:fibronectin type 3 domain-containing protein
VGTSSALSTTLTNNGNSNVTISSVTVAGTGFSVSGVAAGTVLTPNQSVTLSVAFAPTLAGTATGSVTVLSSATNSPAVIALSGTGVQHYVTLNWTASASVVAGYYIYRGTQTSGPYTKLNFTPVAALTYNDSTVQSGLTYFYVVTAVDSNGVESPYTSDVSATIP